MPSPRVVAVRSLRLIEDLPPTPGGRGAADDLVGVRHWIEDAQRVLDARDQDTRQSVSLLADWATRLAAIRTVTAAYQVDEEDFIILADATGGAFNVTLPDVVVGEGHEYVIKRINAGANAVTILPASGTIDGAASVVLGTQYHLRRLAPDGTNWYVIGQ